MRQERTVQASIFDLFAEHEIGRELQAISHWLDAHCDVLGQVAEDLRRRDLKETGRQGLPAEAVLRCALLKQYRQLSYQELAFHLEDSASSGYIDLEQRTLQTIDNPFGTRLLPMS